MMAYWFLIVSTSLDHNQQFHTHYVSDRNMFELSHTTNMSIVKSRYDSYVYSNQTNCFVCHDMSYRDIDFQMTVFIGWIDPYPADSDSQISDLISSEWFTLRSSYGSIWRKKGSRKRYSQIKPVTDGGVGHFNDLYLFMCQSQHAFCYI